ncbi:MAG: hypothetical protein C0582_02910 [Alphaproteobacteria bacterium]|nr:MAG: hypothetical protein C0582_02910 [Alphaproteobacteria bacterium]
MRYLGTRNNFNIYKLFLLMGFFSSGLGLDVNANANANAEQSSNSFDEESRNKKTQTIKSTAINSRDLNNTAQKETQGCIRVVYEVPEKEDQRPLTPLQSINRMLYRR